MARRSHRRKQLGIVFGIAYREVGDGIHAYGKPQVVACEHAASNVHVNTVRRVGHYRAAEAPFVPEHFGKQAVMSARPRRAYAVERTHDAARAALLDGILERRQIHFADRLLVYPDGYAVALGFEVVDGEMFDVRVQTLFLRASDFFGSHFARKEGVFGEVFEVTAGVRRAVNIERRSVPAGYPEHEAVLAHALAHFVHDIGVPGRSEHDRRLIRDGRYIPYLFSAETGRAVRVNRGGFADAVYRHVAVTAVAYEVHHIAHRELVEQQPPAVVVIRHAAHGYQLVFGISARDYVRRVGVSQLFPVVAVAGQRILDDVFGGGERKRFGERVPVRSRHFAVRVLVVAVIDEFGFIEPVCYFISG